jgi:hypothetical protein
VAIELPNAAAARVADHLAPSAAAHAPDDTIA